MRNRSRCANTSYEMEEETLASGRSSPIISTTKRLYPAKATATNQMEEETFASGRSSPIIPTTKRLHPAKATATNQTAKRKMPARRTSTRYPSNEYLKLSTKAPSATTKTTMDGFLFEEITPPAPQKVTRRKAASLDVRCKGDPLMRLRSASRASSPFVAGAQNKVAPNVFLKSHCETEKGRCRHCKSYPDEELISEWTREMVKDFVSEMFGVELAGKLYNEDIDGRCLLMINDIGWKFINCLPRTKLGPFLRLLAYLKNIR